MNDRNNTKQLEIGLAVLVCLLVAGMVFFYIFGTPFEERQEEAHSVQSMETQEDARMYFKDDSYVLMVKCQKDMSEYLELHNVAEEDVEWSCDSKKVDVGSGGHVAIQDYEVQATLTAKSRQDNEVVATCQIRTLKKADDFQNQMAEYNGSDIDNSEARDREVMVSGHSGQGMIDLGQVSYTPAPKKEDSGQETWDDAVYEEIENVGMPESDSNGEQYVERKQFVDVGDSQPKDYLVYHEPDKKSVSKVMAYNSVQNFLDGKVSGSVTVYYYTEERKLSLVVSYEKYEDVMEEAVSGEEYPSVECAKYYFSEDVMVKWEDVSPNGVTYTLKDYQNGTQELKKQYDDTEAKILNEGYIILQKVEEDAGVQVVTGQIENPSQSAVEIVLHSDELDCDVYKGMTKKDGSYQICVPKVAGEYTLRYKSKEGEGDLVKSLKSKKISVTDSFEFVRQRMQNGGIYE